MKLKIEFLILSFIIALPGFRAIAQQDPQFSQNMFFKLPINPGSAGTGRELRVTGVYRDQWVGFPGAPKTFLFCADAPLDSLLRNGIGLTFVNDKLGNFNFTYVRPAYSFHKNVGKTGLLGIGLETGIIHLNFPAIDTIPSFSGTTYDLGLGAFYRDDQLSVGFSVSHVPGKSEHISGSGFNYQMARHYYFMAEYEFFFSSRGMLIPSILVKSSVVTTYDINLRATYDVNLKRNDLLWIGITYRSGNAIVPMAGWEFRLTETSLLRIGYSYDIGTSAFKKFHTHEFLANYCIKIKGKSE